MNESESDERGIPIYLDSRERSLINTADSTFEPDEWQPGNVPGDRLCKCIEGLRDLQETLNHFLSSGNDAERRRRMKSVVVPLHAECEGIVHLIDAIQSTTSIHDRLPKNCTKELTRLRTEFVSLVPFDRKGKLGKLRNKVSAHYEKTYSPSELRAVLMEIDFTEVGEWINIALGTLCDLLKLDAYMWTAAGPTPKTVILMCQEPIMTVLECEGGRVTNIAGFLMHRKSPKWNAFEEIQKVASLADRLFTRESAFRMSGFVQDQPSDSWSSMLRKSDVKE